jgi:hypothetical protein
MFPLPQSGRANVASQKSLGEDSGYHWIPGIEVAAVVIAVALDNRKILGSRWISSQTGLGKPMGPGYTGDPILASLTQQSTSCGHSGNGVPWSLRHGESMSMERL